MMLHAKAAASAHVVLSHQRGASSTKVYYAIEEYCKSTLRSRIESEGVRDDELFWKWASQIARGVADIHRAGIIHLGIHPEAIALTENDGVRIGDFHRACEADDAKVHEPFSRAVDKPEYRAPEDEAFGDVPCVAPALGLTLQVTPATTRTDGIAGNHLALTVLMTVSMTVLMTALMVTTWN